jgi:hypothetical protein
MLVAEAAATLYRKLVNEPPFGLGMMRHCAPSQCSTSVSEVMSLVSADPTTQILLLEIAVML